MYEYDVYRYNDSEQTGTATDKIQTRGNSRACDARGKLVNGLNVANGNAPVE